MRLLVLGGTSFVGRAVVEAARLRQWDVTTFNRGQSGPDVAGVEVVRGDRYDSGAVAALGEHGPWDGLVDCSGYVPSNVLSVTRVLAARVTHAVFMSTVSVYADWPVKPLSEASTVLYCPPNADADYGTDTEDGPTKYGYQKSGCEAATRLTFGDSRVAILRPGVILGRREYVGRLPWWLRRVAHGGQVIAPGSPSRTLQPIDVRDVADFTLACAEHGLAGAFNVAAPIGRDTFGGLIDACVRATHSDAEIIWIPDEVLLAHGVRQWSEMPLWRTYDGVWKVDATKAADAGLVSRALAETVLDTWTWMQSAGEVNEHDRASEIGLTVDHERELLDIARGKIRAS